MVSRVLLVEGIEDVGFFSKFCSLTEFSNIRIEPKKPSDLGESGNGWTNVIKQIPLQLRRLREVDSGLSGLGIVIDADFPQISTGGFVTRYDAISKILVEHGYNLVSSPRNNEDGFIFEHGDGLPQVGLWIMPNNSADGMLEDFAEQLIQANEQQALLQHAKSAIDTLPHTLFKPAHARKALIGTWRAWQKTPSGPLSQAIKDEAMDLHCLTAQRFRNWLTATFTDL